MLARGRSGSRQSSSGAEAALAANGVPAVVADAFGDPGAG